MTRINGCLTAPMSWLIGSLAQNWISIETSLIGITQTSIYRACNIFSFPIRIHNLQHTEQGNSI